jgi:hypothetical protein
LQDNNGGQRNSLAAIVVFPAVTLRKVTESVPA